LELSGNNLKQPQEQEVIQELESLLIPVSLDNGTALRTPSTPQNNALNWLAININLDFYSDAQKIQRYALATLFFSTNGASWLTKDGWLSNSDECAWYSDADSSFCDENGSVKDLSLSYNNLVGTIPKEIALMLNLCELSVVWLLVVMIVLSCVFLLYSHACLSFIILQLGWVLVTIV
jgi:hypothetical protein